MPDTGGMPTASQLLGGLALTYLFTALMINLIARGRHPHPLCIAAVWMWHRIKPAARSPLAPLRPHPPVSGRRLEPHPTGLHPDVHAASIPVAGRRAVKARRLRQVPNAGE